MILGGLVFFFSSTHALFGRGPDYLTYAYHSIGRFAFAFLLFYGLAGFFTAAFHFSYLAFGKPNQAFAAIYAIGIAVGLVLVSLALMEWLMSQRVF